MAICLGVIFVKKITMLTLKEESNCRFSIENCINIRHQNENNFEFARTITLMEQ